MAIKKFEAKTGNGLGCFFSLLGLAIFLSFDKVLALIGFALGKCR